MNSITNSLTEIGLSDNESRVYFHVLSAGSSTPKDVARALDIPRSTAYEVLQSLERKGFAYNEEGTQGITMYRASKPDVLLSQVDVYLKRYEEAESALTDVSAELEKLRPKFSAEPGVDFFDHGSEDSVYMDILGSGELAIACILSSKVTGSPVEAKASIFFEQLHTSGVEMSGILEKGCSGLASLGLVAGQRCEVENSPFDIDTDVYIYGEKIALISYAEKFGAIIKTPDIADGMRELLILALEQVKYENGVSNISPTT